MGSDAEREMIAWRAAIQRLTPGGSEFTTPAEVERWVQERNREHAETKKALVRAMRVVNAAMAHYRACSAFDKAYEDPKLRYSFQELASLNQEGSGTHEAEQEACRAYEEAEQGKETQCCGRCCGTESGS